MDEANVPNLINSLRILSITNAMSYFLLQVQAKWQRQPSFWAHLHRPHVRVEIWLVPIKACDWSVVTFSVLWLIEIVKLLKSNHRLSIHWRQDRGWGQPRFGLAERLFLFKIFDWSFQYQGMMDDKSISSAFMQNNAKY